MPFTANDCIIRGQAHISTDFISNMYFNVGHATCWVDGINYATDIIMLNYQSVLGHPGVVWLLHNIWHMTAKNNEHAVRRLIRKSINIMITARLRP